VSPERTSPRSAGGLGRRIAFLAAGAVALAACGGSSHHPQAAKPTTTTSSSIAPSTTPAHTALTALELLSRSRAVLDKTPAVHFKLTSAGIAPGTTALLSGSGDLVRPDELSGALLVTDSGVSATIKVIAVSGKFYALLPFTSHYEATNPASYGLGDPAQLLSPTDGVSSLLTAMRHPRLDSSIRLDGELLDVVSGTVAGSQVPVLSDLDKAKPVNITADISPTSFQLRRVQMAGPFTKATTTTTYDVTLTAYGEHVTITAPKT
jgi:lipoprotein LprG